MLWFELTDGTAKLACKVFRIDVAGLEHKPQHGDRVQVQIDRPDLWPQGGRLDVIVSEIRLAGEGELLRRREELLARLAKEGLCDPSRRRPLPQFPRAVGVIAGRSSEGMNDVVAAVHARFPPAHIITCAAVVQGARAPIDIIDALATLEAHPLVDVIVIVRGGGSVQDLLAFDDERLCRAVSVCTAPVIAAIGHTGNVPVCNHVAWAAETPSRAPELAVPSATELRQALGIADARLAPVLGRVRALHAGVRTVRVDVHSVLRAKRLDVAATAADLRSAEHAFFSLRGTVLARARETLAAVPARIPAAADIDAPAARLDTHAVTFFTGQSHEVRRAGDFGGAVRASLRDHIHKVREASPMLPAALGGIERRKHDVLRATPDGPRLLAALETRVSAIAADDNRLTAGIRKELADHLHDYRRALARQLKAMRDAIDRRVTNEDRRLAGASNDLTLSSKRGITDAQRSLAHVTAVLAASDPRGRRWVLPSRPDGQVVRSVADLAIGDHPTLGFHDGDAGALIDTVPQKETA
jgi:exodeoxyribonuclease VII large subunit